MSRVIDHRSSRRGSIAVAVAIAALGVAFVWVPARVVGGATVSRPVLRRSTADAVAAYWHSGRAAWTDEIRDLIDQWRSYHLVKAVIAGAAVVLLAQVAVRSRRRASTGVHPMRRAVGAAATGTGLLLAVLVLIANIQGAAAPFASLLSVLPAPAANRSFAPTSGEIRDALAQRATSGHAGAPALERMIDAFVDYHVVLAVLAGALAVSAAVVVVRGLARRQRSAGAAASTARRGLVALTGPALVCVAAGVLCLANVSTALRPVPVLRDAFAAGPDRPAVDQAGRLTVVSTPSAGAR